MEACEKTLTRLEKEIQDFYGTREPPVLATALTLHVWGDLKNQRRFSLERALSDLQKALMIYTTAWKGEHKILLQGFTHFVKGQVYAHHNQPRKALQAYQNVEKVYDTILRHKAIEDVSLLYDALIQLADHLQDLTLSKIAPLHNIFLKKVLFQLPESCRMKFAEMLPICYLSLFSSCDIF